jgi:hypothetical protein
MSSVIYLALAGVAGVLAGAVRAGGVPYATAACGLAALIMAVTVSLPLGDQGPHLFDVAMLPATVGALVGAAATRLGLEALARRERARS